MNRIVAAFERMEKQVTAAGPGALDRLPAGALDVTPADVARFNDWRALAQAGGRITHDESMSLYAVCGAAGWTADASPARRMVYLKTMQELGRGLMAAAG
jgi:hypothetical protein